MGAWGTPLIYAFREREKILDLFEALSGSRKMCNYIRFGGCHTDVPPGWIEEARKVVEAFPFFLDELEALIVSNEIVLARTQNIGQLPGDLAINAGVSGPMLRASWIDHDVRKVDGYGIYPRFKFRVPLGEHGDCYDRQRIRTGAGSVRLASSISLCWNDYVSAARLQMSSLSLVVSISSSGSGPLAMFGAGILKGMRVTASNFFRSYGYTVALAKWIRWSAGSRYSLISLNGPACYLPSSAA